MNNFSKNLNNIIHNLGFSQKETAEKIGISVNTLSNILNQKFLPSDETKFLIEKFIERNGFEKSDLFKEKKTIMNARFRINAELSGNEKAAFRKFVRRLEEIFELSFYMEYKNYGKEKYMISTNEFFDVYTRPYKEESLFEPSLRLAEFIKIKNKKQWNAAEWLDYFLNAKKSTKDFFGLPYCSLNFSYFKPDILELVSSLGIKIGFFPFGTKKIEAISTSLEFKEYECDGSIYYPPAIIINTNACKTFEKFRFIVAKEFFHQIDNRRKDEFGKLDSENFILQGKSDGEADFFARNFLLPIGIVEKVFNDFAKYGYPKWNTIVMLKGKLNVSARLLISQLSELEVFDYGFNEYVADFEREANQDGIKYQEIDGEPCWNPSNYRKFDFFTCIFIAAYKKGNISKEKISTLFELSVDEIEIEQKRHARVIEEMLESSPVF